MKKKSAHLLVPLVLSSLAAVSGCEPPRPQFSPPPPIERFKLVTTPDGKTLRLNTQDGQVLELTSKGLSFVPTYETVKLIVGDIYQLENGERLVYEGNQKFGSKDATLEAILKKYSKQSDAEQSP